MQHKPLDMKAMTANLILLLVSVSIVAGAIAIRIANPMVATLAHYRYYTVSGILIGSILAVIALLRMVHARRKPVSMPATEHGKTIDNRRSEYRLVFDAPPRPAFLQKSDGPDSVPIFTCPVWDVSETAISLDCSGVYVSGQTIQGEIIFDSGCTAPINGVVRRTNGKRTVLQLHCSIDPTLIMAEQRERIASKKDTGPKPAVGVTYDDEVGRSLPSHQPKGSCRLKRP